MSIAPKNILRSVCALAVLMLCAAFPVAAQTTGNGNINGTVTDPTGAVVAGASVIVTDIDTGVSRTLTTNSAGAYTAPFLTPGNYEVVASAGTFGKIDRKNILLTVGEVLTIDVALPAASVSTAVEVTSESPILDTEKTEVSQTLGETLVSNLPVATRNFNAFVLLTPNVTQDGTSGLISFHGISGLYNQTYVDGANNNQMLFSEGRGRASGAPYVYSIDSIKEFQAETAVYGVEFGQAAGGQVNAITRSGTNHIHGDAFYYLRYPALNALDPYNKFQALHNGATPFLLTQPIHQQNQFGGSVGGPIIKDKLFFFFTYDGFRKVGRVLYSDTNTITTTPTASNSAGTVVSPTQCPTTITATQCLSGINFLLGVGNLSAGSAPPGRFQKQNLFFPRLDYHISRRNDIFVDYNFADFDSTFGYSPANTFSNSSPSTNGSTSYHERFLVGGLTTQIGKASINQFHGQYGRDLETASANASGPSVATGVVTFGMPNGLPRIAEPDEHRIQLSDVFSTTKGHHTFKFGGDANIVHEVMINLFQGGGLYGYSDTNNAASFADWIQDAFQGQAGNTDPYQGFRYNTFVQTIDVVNTAAGQQGKDDFWMKMYDAFAEDSWKIRPNLTVTAGVRYDIQLTPPPGKINTNFAPISNIYTQTIKNTSRIQPRIGFAWQVQPGTLVRGGYGLFSALTQGSTYYAMRVENGVVQINYNFTGCESGATQVSRCPTVPSAAALLKYPNVPFPVTGPSLSGALFPVGGTAPAVNGPSVQGAQSFHGLDPNFVPPLAHEWQLGIEQALPGKMSVTATYVGTRALRLPAFLDANLIGQTPHGERTYDVLNSAGAVVNALTVPVYLQSDRRQANLAQFNTGFSAANTWYNSAALTVRRPFANGLEFIGNYTWAHATDTSAVEGNFGTFYGGDTPLDPNNLRIENGPSDTDIRNRFTLVTVYKPHLWESNKIAKYGLDPFTFSVTEIASGGEPISLGMSGSNPFSGTGTSYGADGGIYGGAMSSSSGAPTLGRPPQVGRNSIGGPGFNNVDLRISRDIPIHEKIYMQFSADAFNALNHTIISGVNGTLSTFANSASSGTCSTAAGSPTQSTVPTGSALQGCISPFTGTGLSAFGAANGTNSLLYGARQMEFKAKLFF